MKLAGTQVVQACDTCGKDPADVHASDGGFYCRPCFVRAQLLRLTVDEVEERYRQGRVSEADTRWFVEQWNKGPHFCTAELRDGAIRLTLKP